MSISDPTIGEITMFAGNFAPRSWALCDGQLLSIAQNTALFSIIGTTYGGDGRTTMGLPDLRSRFPLHPGNGPGLPSYRLGERGGRTDTTLTQANLPSHSHTATLHAEAAFATSRIPTGNMLGANNTGEAPQFAPFDAAENIAMSPESVVVANTGGGQGFSIQNPFLGVNFIIALFGIFPSRN